LFSVAFVDVPGFAGCLATGQIGRNEWLAIYGTLDWRRMPANIWTVFLTPLWLRLSIVKRAGSVEAYGPF
jgi:hypothetical protein